MSHDIADPGLAADGALRVEWARRRMPVLASIRERFEKETPLAGIRLGACLHVTAETANLMETLRAGGAEVALCASNPLSTQDDVAAALVASGIPVYAVRGEDAESYYSHIRAVLDIEPHITMDDGADLVTTLLKERPHQLPIGSTEETTTGVIRLRAMARAGVLRFPVVAVNDSATKHLFDNHHGTGQSALDGVIRSTNILLAGKTVVVIGYGDCGIGVAARADGMGARVIVVEVDPVRALSAAMEGYQVTTVDEAARVGDLFITVTGDLHVLRGEHFDVMRDGAVLANAGHFDVEIDLGDLERRATGKRRIRHELDEWAMPDGRRLHVVAEGRLVNLGAAEGHPAEVMDMSFANQALAAEWLLASADELEPQVYRLPEALDADVAAIALEAMGGRLERLTEEQKAYLASWEMGT
ncbi:MAG: adenosylhomocysteinase [Actinobacteria bacterium RBG_16_68_21]|nr:MAG: adenosylhomocysteinase [Actinobacteria bacterium RBG_16_68_21]